jgi:hypothetical protein
MSAEITDVNKIRKKINPYCLSVLWIDLMLQFLTWKRLSITKYGRNSIVSDFLVFYGPEAAKVLVAMQ